MKLQRISARAVIFDWDGTLLDSFRADTRAYRAMFHALEINFSDRQLARHYSPDWYRVYRAAKIPGRQWDLADRLWAAAYRKENPRLLPGARAVLNKLSRSFALGLVTSGDRKRVLRQLRQFGFQGLFPACICSEDAPRRKPHPAPLLAAMRCMRMNAADCVYVGDTPEDIEMAHSAGVRSVGVIGPFPSSAKLKAAHPGMLLESITDLPEVLLPAAKAL
ncbi:MAG: HAD family hydrolase [Candidatus Acidiferrales bacterium]